jgi:hypothetical protein
VNPLRRRLVAIALSLALGATGCSDGFDATCRAKNGRVDVTWNAIEGFDSYRVYRIVDGQMVPAEDTSATAFVDSPTDDRVGHDYVILPLAADGTESRDAMAACNAPAVDRDGGAGPDAVADLTCRPKSGKVDLAWTPVDGAASYRVLRAPAGATDLSELGEIAQPPFADFGVVDGNEYQYAVVAVDANGGTSPASTACFATPRPRGDGDPPPAVGALDCRGKRDKVDVTWEPSPGAAFHRIYRSAAGGLLTPIGEVIGGTFVDFGLPVGTPHSYRVRAVAADGTESDDSALCSFTATERDGDNRPPLISSIPATNALEDRVYAYDVVVVDPDSDPVVLSTVSAPTGMFFEDETRRLFWIPTAAQIGPHTVEIRATDARGAFATQAFVVTAADFNEPPRITTVPGSRAQVGERYVYDVDAFDPDDDALSFGFAAAAPPGMTIDPATGLIAWTPLEPLAGQSVVVRVSDAGGAFEDQTYTIDATRDPLVLDSPDGEFQIEVGQTLELAFVANYPNARFSVHPIPANATNRDGVFRFTPTSAQVGRHEFLAKAILSGLIDANRIVVNVIGSNAPPILGALAGVEVAEGEGLRVPVAATDPDGDPLTITAPGLALENAFFDEFASEFVFQPSFEQAGAYEVRFEASDGVAVAETRLAITVTDAEPPVDALDLVVNPPQSPTFVPRQTISGSVTGEVASAAPARAALVTGLVPTNVEQGRSATIAITGRDTNFVQGEISATFGDGVSVDSITVNSPTQATAQITVAPTAATGIRQMRVRQAGQEVPSVVAFRIEAGAAVVRGRLVDSFTGEPLVGVRVTVNGTNVSATTQADGTFEIAGVPPGAQTIVALAPNFDVLELPVQVEQNATYQIDEPIRLDALARPARPGGSLPRSQTLASILDRGISTVEQPMSQEQAELLITDTMIAVGVDQLGVVDEAGAQLNPRVAGGGMLSLTPAAVRFFADRLVRGDTYTLGQLLFYLQGAFGWVFEGMEVESQIERLQLSVRDAWVNASDPDYALVIAIFNPAGTTLSTAPPILTPDTQLNSFQGFLLVSSFLVRSFPVLDMAFDRKLRDRGIDPADVLRDNGVDPDLYGATSSQRRSGGGAVTQIAARAAGWFGLAGDLVLGVPAHAQVEPPPAPPSAFARVRGGVANLFSMQTLTSAFVSGAVNVVFAVAVAGVLAVLGVAAPAAALSVIGVFLLGFVTTMIAKLVGGFLADPGLPQRYAPSPPAVISQIAPDLDDPNFYIRFRRAQNDVESDRARRENPDLGAPLTIDLSGWVQDGFQYLDGTIDTRLLEHRYVLWKLPCNPDDPACRANLGTSLRGREPIARDSFLAPLSQAEIDAEPLIRAPGYFVDPKYGHAGEFEQFRVSKKRLSNGSNFFQIQTLQFYRRIWTGNDPDDDTISIPYPEVGIPDDELPYEGAPSTGLGAVDAFRGNGAQEASKLVRRGLGIPFRNLVIQEQADQLDLQRLAAARISAEERLVRAQTSLMRLGIIPAPLEDAEKRVSEALAAIKARVQPVLPQLQAHRTLVQRIDRTLAETGATLATTEEIFERATSGSTVGAQRTRAALGLSPTGAGEFQRYITVKLGEHRIGLGIARHNDSIVALREMRQRLSLTYRAQPQTPTFPSFNFSDTVEGLPGRLQIDGTVVARTQTPRVPFTVSQTISSVAELDAAFAQIDTEIARQQSEIQRLNDIRSGNTGTFRAEADARIRGLQEAYFDPDQFGGDLERYELAKKRAEVAQKSVALQKEAADIDQRRAAVRRNPLLGDPGAPRGFRAGLKEAAAQRRALVATEGHMKGIRGSFGLNTANVVGVAVEVGNEIHGLRSGLDMLTSPLSATIVVNATVGPIDPITGNPQIAVTSAPVVSAGVFDTSEPIPVASRFGDGDPDGDLPRIAKLVARGPLARLMQAPMAIDDAGRSIFGARRGISAFSQRVQFTGPGGAPIQFETDPDPLHHLAVLYPAGPPPENPREGFLFRDFPFSPPTAERFSAGFPSELIAVDSDGNVYLQNYNSNEAFGGRIFRFSGEPAVREHIGSVNYFSQTLMYAHPAFPIAMEIGDATTEAYGVVEDLFVVNKDLGVYFDAGRQPVHRVLRVPIHLADRVPAYMNGQNRNRLVGQPWAEHPDFRFDGPTDLEVDGRGSASFASGERPLYLSDMDSVYVLRDANHDGTAEVAKIIEVAGRLFSGIASDTAGNLYVADYASGDVFLIGQQTLDEILAGGAPIGSDGQLQERAFLIKIGLDRPGDVELDSYQHRYIVSTPGGLEPFDIPLVGRMPAGVAEIRVDALGHELPVTQRSGIFFVGANSEGTFAGKEVRIRVRRVDAETGQSIWKSHLIRTQLYGASVLRDGALETSP